MEHKKQKKITFPEIFTKRFVNIEPHELKAVLWSFSYFFALLCSYYILRPIRDEMGIAGGVKNLQWLFTGTFLVMLVAVPIFGWASSRFDRKKLLPHVYIFFFINLLFFYFLLKFEGRQVWIARAFFIWTSVFNLFIVSVFWSFMTEIYNNDQAKRLFGFIAAGGTAGALTGPALTALLATHIGATNLILISSGFLLLALFSIKSLIRWDNKDLLSENSHNLRHAHGWQKFGGNALEGVKLILKSPYLIGICLVILFYTTLSTFLYIQQAQIIKNNFSDAGLRTSLFAGIDLATNSLTLFLQVLFVSRIVKAIRLPWTLAMIPLLLGIGFLILGFFPIVTTLVLFQVIRRAGNYAIMRPAREMLFVVVNPVEKYKAKNIIDTVVYRSGDAVSSWVYSGLLSLGLSLSAIAFIAVPIAGIWAWISYLLGKKQEILAKQFNQKR